MEPFVWDEWPAYFRGALRLLSEPTGETPEGTGRPSTLLDAALLDGIDKSVGDRRRVPVVQSRQRLRITPRFGSQYVPAEAERVARDPPCSFSAFL
jgi:hypothetical protein